MNKHWQNSQVNCGVAFQQNVRLVVTVKLENCYQETQGFKTVKLSLNTDIHFPQSLTARYTHRYYSFLLQLFTINSSKGSQMSLLRQQYFDMLVWLKLGYPG